MRDKSSNTRSNRSEEVRAAITGELGRGVKGVVRAIDRSAFVIIHALADAEGGENCSVSHGVNGVNGCS